MTTGFPLFAADLASQLLDAVIGADHVIGQ